MASAGSRGTVLAGAAALGAYEVGVISHVFDGVLAEIGPAPWAVTGTSAGAINAATLAALADRPRVATELLVRAWSELELGRVIRPSSVELLSMLLDLVGAPARWRRALQARTLRGGLLDPGPIAALVARVPLARIGDNLATGCLAGIAISTTRVADGAAVVFYDAPAAPAWASGTNLVAVREPISDAHVLASAAIPLLFPTVAIAGEAYCDGGLRQMVPLAPAIHLGANRLLVINPLPAARPSHGPAPAVLSPLYLIGKALNALFADRVEADLARLAHTTAILRAGHARFGATFERELNEELAGEGGAPLRPIETLSIVPSRDLGVLAAEHVASRRFTARTRGPVARLLRRIADGDPERAGDLLAYLLFDGGFAAELIALGREDARARHAELCAFLT